MRLTASAGALAERNFRLLFTSSTISGLGDGISLIALVFAVLQVSDSAVALGLVLAARQVADAAIILAAGVWSDRFPRHVLLIAVAIVQGAVQAATGALVLTGAATVALLIGLQALYGLAEGFVLPASTGLTPATISPSRLQEANALLGLSRNGTRIIGPAIGGALVAVGSPGLALLADAVSFAVAAVLLWRLQLPARAEVVEAKPFFADLREGWGEFKRQTWIWTTIVFFGIGNFAFSSYFVLGEGEVADPEEDDRRPDPGLALELAPAFPQVGEERLRFDDLGSSGQLQAPQEHGRDGKRHGVGKERQARASDRDERAADRRADDACPVAGEPEEGICLLEARGADCRGGQPGRGRKHEALGKAVEGLEADEQRHGRGSREHERTGRGLHGALHDRNGDQQHMAGEA